MNRPDQERFDRFSGLFTVFDSELGRFCEANAFEMEINANRLPCRVLRRQRCSLELIGIYLDGDWKTLDYSDHRPCTFDICSYFEINDEKQKLYKIENNLCSEKSFAPMASKIEELLQQSLTIFDIWSPEFIMKAGEEIENLKRRYERGELG